MRRRFNSFLLWIVFACVVVIASSYPYATALVVGGVVASLVLALLVALFVIWKRERDREREYFDWINRITGQSPTSRKRIHHR